ncbi:MAG: 2-phosphosulfolactate phosphatase [Candidatus Electryoneaceae bacterium]|nr:2-phosphosulfolactate phosphatase [Candidatus Electryoneaceae bacterium]
MLSSMFDIRCEWGENGVIQLAPDSDAVIIVDVMSFSTATQMAISRGATVYPYRFKDDSAVEFSNSVDAELAGSRGKSKFSLSPNSLMNIPSGTRLVLPSPNGATLTLLTGNIPTLAGCLRNSRSIAKIASRYGKRISVIPAGERWRNDGGLRPAFEDFLGAGAIIRYLDGYRSPEAEAALAVFDRFKDNLHQLLKQCTSGKELIDMGFEDDIATIAELDCDDCVPILKGSVYVRADT